MVPRKKKGIKKESYRIERDRKSHTNKYAKNLLIHHKFKKKTAQPVLKGQAFHYQVQCVLIP